MVELIQIKAGTDLTADELEVINSGRKMAFGAEDKIEPRLDDKNRETRFFLLKNSGENILAFGKLHLMKVVFQTQAYPVYCISTLVSLEMDKGYGKKLMKGIESYLVDKTMTAFAFCETDLLPFYRKCGLEILAKENNQFYYIEKNGKAITNLNIVPGEVVFIRGKDSLMERILASADKGVGVAAVGLGPTTSSM